jgi:hypothetical protein
MIGDAISDVCVVFIKARSRTSGIQRMLEERRGKPSSD